MTKVIQDLKNKFNKDRNTDDNTSKNEDEIEKLNIPMRKLR